MKFILFYFIFLINIEYYSHSKQNRIKLTTLTHSQRDSQAGRRPPSPN